MDCFSNGSNGYYEKVVETEKELCDSIDFVKVACYIRGELDMKRAIATVVRVTSTCNVGYQVGDKVVVNLDNACIEKEHSSNLCIFALDAILANMCRIRQEEKTLASCPDPATGLGGNVIFSVAKEDYYDEGSSKPK